MNMNFDLPDPEADPDIGYSDDVELLTGKPLAVDITLVEQAVKAFNDRLNEVAKGEFQSDEDVEYPRPEDFYGQDDEDDEGSTAC